MAANLTSPAREIRAAQMFQFLLTQFSVNEIYVKGLKGGWEKREKEDHNLHSRIKSRTFYSARLPRHTHTHA